MLDRWTPRPVPSLQIGRIPFNLPSRKGEAFVFPPSNRSSFHLCGADSNQHDRLLNRVGFALYNDAPVLEAPDLLFSVAKLGEYLISVLAQSGRRPLCNAGGT